MKKKILYCIVVLVLLPLNTSFADLIWNDSISDASLMTGGSYSPAPEDWNVSSYTNYSGREPVILSHNYYFTIGLDDSRIDGSDLTIVFHDILNGDLGPNTLDIWLFDEPVSGPIISDLTLAGWDYEDPNAPDWVGEYNGTWIATWSDTDSGDSIDDLVITVSSDFLTSYVNGNTFGIGIDPDCHFVGTEITVASSVPEPASMFLFGTGLVGLASIGRFGRKKA